MDDDTHLYPAFDYDNQEILVCIGSAGAPPIPKNIGARMADDDTVIVASDTVPVLISHGDTEGKLFADEDGGAYTMETDPLRIVVHRVFRNNTTKAISVRRSHLIGHAKDWGIHLAAAQGFSISIPAGKILLCEFVFLIPEPWLLNFARILLAAFTEQKQEITSDVDDDWDLDASALLTTDVWLRFGTTTSWQMGIVVGTSDQAFDIGDNKLIAQIEDGTGSGQLEFGVMAQSGVLQVTGNHYKLELSRTLTNSSGGSITIKEVGIVGSITHTSSGTCRVLVMRKVLDTPIVIANTECKTITVPIEINA
jgi:hypothetical protein